MHNLPKFNQLIKVKYIGQTKQYLKIRCYIQHISLNLTLEATRTKNYENGKLHIL